MPLKLYLLGCMLAAALPFIADGRKPEAPPAGEFPGWPASFEGRPLEPRELSERDRRFAEGFPGRIAAFDDGRRRILIRWVTSPTRRLHPAADCFRGAGYRVTPQPLRVDPEGRAWGCFTAHREGASLRVIEQIRDDRGRAWPDVSAWYWAALAQRSAGPWWSLTVIESQ